MNYYIITETNWAKLRDEILSLAECCHKAFGEKSKHTDWLHNGDVCRLLNISKRTLQHYSDTGVLPFTQIGPSAITSAKMWKHFFLRSRTNLKTDRYNGNSKRLEHGDGRDAAGRLGIERCRQTNSGSGADAQATLCWRTFPHEQGSVRATVHQSPHFTGLPRQENHSLTRSLQGRYSTKLRTWKKCWRRITSEGIDFV